MLKNGAEFKMAGHPWCWSQWSAQEIQCWMWTQHECRKLVLN